MNIHRQQRPYVFHPPQYSPFVAWLLAGVSGYLRVKKQRVANVHVHGGEHLAFAAAQGCPVLITPNHADHADPHVLVHAARAQGVALHFMAAREGFERGRLVAWALQRMGAFSVDREGADVAAIKTAIQVLREARFPLVIFPEGEIYHHHEQLDELNEGAAKIMMRSIGKQGEATGLVVPTALRYIHDARVESTFAARLDRLESRIAWTPRPDMDIVERIYRLGRGLLALREEEFLGRVRTGDIVARIQQQQQDLVAHVEARHPEAAVTGSVPQRVKALRSCIRKRLIDDVTALEDGEEACLYRDLEMLFAAVQLYSYPGQYLSEHPTRDRIAETLLKLEEDVLGEGTYPAPREAHVVFGEPIDVRRFLQDGAYDATSGVAPLTRAIAERIVALLANVTTDEEASDD